MYGLNTVAAFLLIVSFILPFLPPSAFPTLSLLSLAVSPLILLNMLFGLYWLVRLKKKFFLSLIVLVIAYFHFNPFFEISSEGDASKFENSLSIVSYNVRLFNAYEKVPVDIDVAANISALIKDQTPDVICIQEYYADHPANFEGYPYQFIHFKGENTKLGHAIFSKYPIVNKGAFDFEDSYNNTLFADVLVKSDTIRIYNLHLQSLGILPDVGFLQKRGAEKIKKRIAETFVQQQEQVGEIIHHKRGAPKKTLLVGDFNNTSFSYTYRQLQHSMQDAFLERGNGLGTTYLFDRYPMRIDYILATDAFEVLRYESVDATFSDHYPLSATVAW